jgi:mono/diheme cytochrome c family protein
MTCRLTLPALIALAALLGLRQTSLSTDPPGQSAPAAAVSFHQDVAPFLTKHCYACHGNGKKKGELALDKYQDEAALQKDRKVWESVLQMVRTGEMPPKGKNRKPPTPAEVEPWLKAVDTLLARYDCTGVHNAGRVTVRRLNRTEYNNTIRDLVGVDFRPAADFPQDDVGYGFDNIGDVLSVSPLLLEKYLAAAEAILEQAILVMDQPKPTLRRLERNGGMRVFPRGSGEMVKGVGAVIRARGSAGAQTYLPEGDYTIRVRLYAKQAGTEPVRAAVRVKGSELKTFEVKADNADAAETVEVKARLNAESTFVSVSFLNPLRDEDKKDPKEQRELIVRTLEVDGPYNPPPLPYPESHRRIMAHTPGLPPREAAGEIVSRFANRAFRRPVQPAEVERFLTLFDAATKEGDRFEKAVQVALQGVLVSPHFLFRIELDRPGAKPQTAYAVSEYELASRLSYFLWSGMPDDELLALAGRGKLRANLDAQVRRMLQDRKSSAFVQNFAGQWLTIRNLQSATPDPKAFPDFDDELRAAMARETELFFEAILREDRSILDFLDADFSFVNERLARHYGIPGVKGKEFRRVKLPANRGGLLTQASILTLTSNPTRTSPVKRGKWVLEQLLGTPPPPPPPNAGDLEDDAKAQLSGSLRQRMEQHRKNPSCAVCHNRLDPLGFAFENYDAVGAWRTKDGKFDIDPSGVLPDGRSFKGPAELKALLKGQKDLFGRCLAEKLLTYALGRGLEYYDRCAVDQILGGLAQKDYRFSALVAEVVKSEPFQKRMVSGSKP